MFRYRCTNVIVIAHIPFPSYIYVCLGMCAREIIFNRNKAFLNCDPYSILFCSRYDITRIYQSAEV